ncbi:PP2C family protein-serine/threonine phosphatase [Kineococcus radiotolerans]|uniref:Stage II sporulation E family protein n=1 Tax=Kineococcus radiotolerans (strain ATCC BAA-149 / DSM 14245 / SRS30216) TaxID=266940 RepID=A6WAQ0_KINRD|nr:PP2C family protein-serine/threonine phosphatase [Kineococcus radiotolerans]ABS03889.1 Stage II sporulation E family protein [Kineococcus radiotolerans SRS30216 = ATCC BAA-149]
MVLQPALRPHPAPRGGWRHQPRRAWTQRLRAWLPAAVLVLVALIDLLTGPTVVLLAFVIIAPLLAASSLPARTTAAYGLIALAEGAALGAAQGQYADALDTQLVRLSIIVTCTVLSTFTAHSRTGREEHLLRVTRIAAIAQSAILPPIPKRLGPLNVAASYDSADTEADIGGDAYAAFTTPHGIRLLLADVRGHGLDAVHLAATVLGSFRERAHERHDLTDLAHDLDRAVARAGAEEDFVTALLAEVDAGQLRILNAGHPPALLIRAGAAISLDPARPAPPLGLTTESDPTNGDPTDSDTTQIALEPGDRIVLYTDGVTEARRPRDGAFFPLTRLAAPSLGTGTLPEGLAKLRNAITDWVQGPATDDVTILAIEYAPAASTVPNQGTETHTDTRHRQQRR